MVTTHLSGVTMARPRKYRARPSFCRRKSPTRGNRSFSHATNTTHPASAHYLAQSTGQIQQRYRLRSGYLNGYCGKSA